MTDTPVWWVSVVKGDSKTEESIGPAKYAYAYSLLTLYKETAGRVAFRKLKISMIMFIVSYY